MNHAATMSAGSYREPQPTPSNPIPCALGQLGTAIHEMGITADTLANRLGGVMMPSPPAVESKDRAQLAAATPLTSSTTDEITSLRRRVENIAAQLQDVLNRLEV
jgi:hypothetical protein